MESQLKISIAEEEVLLSSLRALFWPKAKLLVVADLHLGKAEIMQQSGIPISLEVTQEDLFVLKQLLQLYCPDELIFLGDLFHGRLPVPQVLTYLRLLDEVASAQRVTLRWIFGNHDLSLKKIIRDHLPKNLNLSSFEISLKPYALGPFVFDHAPGEDQQNIATSTSEWKICGHLHPFALLRTGRDRLRLPAFALNKNKKELILPAFSKLCGGFVVKADHDTVLFPVFDKEGYIYERTCEGKVTLPAAAQRQSSMVESLGSRSLSESGIRE